MITYRRGNYGQLETRDVRAVVGDRLKMLGRDYVCVWADPLGKRPMAKWLDDHFHKTLVSAEENLVVIHPRHNPGHHIPIAMNFADDHPWEVAHCACGYDSKPEECAA